MSHFLLSKKAGFYKIIMFIFNKKKQQLDDIKVFATSI